MIGGLETDLRPSAGTMHFGPTHPESTTPALPLDEVRWVLAGALEPDSVTVTARLRDEHATGSLLVRTGVDDPGVASPVVATDEYGVVRMRVDGLTPGTADTYRVVVDSGRRRSRLRRPRDGDDERPHVGRTNARDRDVPAPLRLIGRGLAEPHTPASIATATTVRADQPIVRTQFVRTRRCTTRAS